MTTYILWLSGRLDSQTQFLSYLNWTMFSDCNRLYLTALVPCLPTRVCTNTSAQIPLKVYIHLY